MICSFWTAIFKTEATHFKMQILQCQIWDFGWPQVLEKIARWEGCLGECKGPGLVVWAGPFAGLGPFAGGLVWVTFCEPSAANFWRAYCCKLLANIRCTCDVASPRNGYYFKCRERERLRNCWRTFGELSVNFWRTFGKPLTNF